MPIEYLANLLNRLQLCSKFKLFENMEMWACRCRFVNTVHVAVMHYTYYESSFVVKSEGTAVNIHSEQFHILLFLLFLVVNEIE